MEFNTNSTSFNIKKKKEKIQCNKNKQNNEPINTQPSVSKNLMQTLLKQYNIPSNTVQNLVLKLKQRNNSQRNKQKQEKQKTIIKEEKHVNLQNRKNIIGTMKSDILLADGNYEKKEDKGQKKLTKINKKSTLVYIGKGIELPYLHSQDALNHLYSANSQGKQYSFCINPSPVPNQLLTVVQIVLIHTQLQSLRGLGTGWPFLRILTAINCQLVDLSGVNGFNRLQQLYVSYNRIVSIQQLDYLGKKIKCLDLQENLIDENEINTLEMMVSQSSFIQGLQYLNLLGNPIWQRKEIKRQLIQKLGQKIFVQSFYQEKQQQAFNYLHQINNNAIISKDIQLYSQIQDNNRLIQQCNKQLQQNQITVEGCINYYNKILRIEDQQDQEIQIVRYEPQVSIQGEELDQIQDQLIFTPLQHFLPKQHKLSPALIRYLESKLLLTQQQGNETKNKVIQKQRDDKKQRKSLINSVRLSKLIKKEELDFVKDQSTNKNGIASIRSHEITQQNTASSLRVRKFNGLIMAKETQKAKIPSDQMSATSNIDKKFLSSNTEDKVTKLSATSNFREGLRKNLKNLQEQVTTNRHIFKSLQTKQKLKSLHKKILPELKSQLN